MARQRVFLGQAWVFDRRTVSNRARQREIIKVMLNSNNPGGGDYDNYNRLHKVAQNLQRYIHIINIFMCIIPSALF